jgi:uncharacterized protein (TIGR02246 family)
MIAAIQEVLAADDARRAATVRHDTAALDAIFTDDFTYVHGNGFREGKPGYLGRITAGAVRYIALDRLAAEVRIMGDIALVDGTATMDYQFPGDQGPRSQKNLYLAVWVREGARWRMAAYASTLITR